MANRGQSEMSTNSGTSGRGPTRLMSPFSDIPQLGPFVDAEAPQDMAPSGRHAEIAFAGGDGRVARLCAGRMVRNLRMAKG